MASVGHVAVGLAAAELYEHWTGSRQHRALRRVVYVALALLPDADVIGFRLGVPYGAQFGHRGASHSLAAAAAVGLVAWGLLAWRDRARGVWPRLSRTAGHALLLFAVLASHGLLDTLTDGGKGVALFWPMSSERVFAPWRPLPVSPIGVRLISHRGLTVALTELVYFLPLILYGLWPLPRRPAIPVERVAP